MTGRVEMMIDWGKLSESNVPQVLCQPVSQGGVLFGRCTEKGINSRIYSKCRCWGGGSREGLVDMRGTTMRTCEIVLDCVR